MLVGALAMTSICSAQQSPAPTTGPATSQPAMPSIIQTLPNYMGDFWTRQYMTSDWGGART